MPCKPSWMVSNWHLLPVFQPLDTLEVGQNEVDKGRYEQVLGGQGAAQGPRGEHRGTTHIR